MSEKRRSKNGNKTYSVKDIMRRYELSYQTINHYTDFGLLRVSAKKGNTRFYHKDAVEKRMRRIRELMGEGYSLRLIRKKLIGI